MNRHLFTGAAASGAMAVVWVGIGFVGTNFLALVMTAIIGAVYGFGALELRQFRQATWTLSRALAAVPDPIPSLGDWLASVHSSLQNPVRLRIEGERIGLPGPALTPYLVGLLVMLGMLGTFLGMVVTLNGAVFALEGTTDIQAIRSALAAPIKGLGLAFGTSVAGVAASAMLGLMSALSRRERLLTAQLLDTKIGTVLRSFSLTHQRQETFKALQLQSQAMPEVVDKLQSMMAQMERMSEQLNTRLLSNQESFHRDVKGVYTDLACAVDKSLRDSLSQSAQLAGESIRPVVEAAMTGVAQQSQWLQERMVDTFEQRSGSLVAAVNEAYSTLQADQASGDRQRLQVWTQSLETMAATLQREWQHTGEQTSRLLTSAEELMRSRIAAESDWLEQHGDLQTALTGHLTTLGTALEAPITRLIETASEAPRAAAEVIGQLRREVSSSAARDNELLEERSRIMATLSSLLEAINHASVEQRAVIDSLVASSAVALQQAGSQFSENMGAEATKLSDIAAHVTSSAVEVSSLSESFGFAVRSFNEGNEKLMANLQRIEGAMDKSMARSDEQLAYYVAQAREIIDLSILSQKGIFDELRQLPGRQAVSADEVR